MNRTLARVLDATGLRPDDSLDDLDAEAQARVAVALEPPARLTAMTRMTNLGAEMMFFPFSLGARVSGVVVNECLVFGEELRHIMR